MDIERTMEFILEQQAHITAGAALHDAQMAEFRENDAKLQQAFLEMRAQSAVDAAQNALFRKTIAKATAALADNQENTQRRVEGEATLADRKHAEAESLRILDEKWKAAAEERQAVDLALHAADQKWKAEAEKRHIEMEERQAAAERSSKLVEERLAEFIKATNDRLHRVESIQDQRTN